MPLFGITTLLISQKRSVHQSLIEVSSSMAILNSGDVALNISDTKYNKYFPFKEWPEWHDVLTNSMFQNKP